ncbi:hypothetical protein KDX05_07095 [Burkholderia vietnamiensis]|uniref:hypothetical protein n=1 Tax=Burkholderia vietnamiensis TaxID=60552 RepID=UPI001B948D7B|nr:hypothetical protein [Burkholderia vietnamiensis]MBR8228077.1 hypothetical protein [Burkholderia vietnamiensis]
MSTSTLTISVDTSEVVKRIDQMLHEALSDDDILRAVAAWFAPDHPDQGDFIARMRKAITAALTKEAA